MAYAFVRASNQYLSVASTPDVRQPMSLHALIYTTNSTDVQFGLSNHAAGSNRILAIGIDGATAGSPAIFRGRFLATTYNQLSSNGTSLTTWHPIGGAQSSVTAFRVFLDGTRTSGTSGSSINLNDATDEIFIGRERNGANLDGRVAEVALWNVVLSDDEFVSLSKGFKPSRIRPQSLRFYAPIVRNLQNLRDALTFTNNGSATVTEHPRVY
jgi:hypothetical protein